MRNLQWHVSIVSSFEGPPGSPEKETKSQNVRIFATSAGDVLIQTFPSNYSRSIYVIPITIRNISV